MGPNEKEGKASSSGTGSSDWVKTDWVILNRYATGSSWTDTRLGHRQPNTRIELIRGVGLRGSRSSWTDRDWVILSRLRGLMDTRYADWTGTRSESSWTDCAGWTVRDLGLLERITRMWVVLNRIHTRIGSSWTGLREVNGYATDTHTGSSWTEYTDLFN